MERYTVKAEKEISIKKMLLIVGIIFAAFNLRPAITSVGPLIGYIREDLGISNGVAGLLTTIPLIVFAVLSPLAPKFASRYGNETAIFAGLVVLLAGMIIRTFGAMIGLLLGTVLIGVGIAIGNVLLPGIVKERFPDKIGLMTSVYSTAMGMLAGIASGLAIPLSEGLKFGWKNALLFWAILAIVAICLWFPLISGKQRSAKPPIEHISNGFLLQSPLAWQVTFFMGLQSFLFYSMVAWLPEILQADGLSASTAGWMLFLVQIAGLPATFVAPALSDKYADQRRIVAVLGAIYLAGLVGLLYGGPLLLIVFWIILIGIGQGASIGLVLALFGLRTRSSEQASALSGMAQSIGYLLAAFGPILIGVLYDKTHSWVAPILLFIAVCVLMIIAGLNAGRNKYV
ncbi:CP family cyanate transporter-like MFS transporter [Aeribacillus composti]|uniref:CynX/NimT family MFS transporter n=1 Tax=Aeribacillus composti TaxID=1868734 RepID=UPI00119AE0FB|nr:MFS transporter [Aeribacillus composti]TVZ87575.1 CP family cyanate transporter-like MFS transporter [Aeribacillus composti]